MIFPTISPPPSLTVAQMREVDRVMMEDLGITLLQMMENAGRSLALLARERFAPGSVTVLAGSGGNGGGGLAAARHLANRGITVRVATTRPPAELGGVPEQQAAALLDMGIAIDLEPRDADLVIDAVIGYSISGNPTGRAALLIEWANASISPVLALDTPSGLDPTTGIPGEPTVRADATMTLALPKAGLYRAGTEVGDLYLADISVPPAVYRTFGIDLDDPFAAGPVVHVV